MTRAHILFVTGRLAEQALRREVASIAADADFAYSIQVMPITVAALMTPTWIAARIEPPGEATRVLLPGYCGGDLTPVSSRTGLPVDRGPRDLRRLREYFCGGRTVPPDYGSYRIEIIAEINHCPRLALDEILSTARRLRDDGGDIIDVGCDPEGPWAGVGEAVRALRDQGHRVSVDSLDPREIELAVRSGAELVLSVNSSNRQAALDWECEVVAIPDDPLGLAGLDETVELLSSAGVPLRIDPVLEPIGFGFARSLGRYLYVRDRYPDAEIMMGIGNLTELTDADSCAINTLLLGFCEELGIRSVLTTQVINWARTSVRECDLARRLVHYSVKNGVLPKHLEPRLLLLRDETVTEPERQDLETLAATVKDSNYRVFARGGEVHLVSHDLHLQDEDPFALFVRLARSGPEGGAPRNLNPAHAFYLGYEMCKAATALTLGKQYEQDEALDWGFLTREETRHYLRPSSKATDMP